MTKTSTKTAENEVYNPGISEPASHVEVLYGELSNEEETQ